VHALGAESLDKVEQSSRAVDISISGELSGFSLETLVLDRKRAGAIAPEERGNADRRPFDTAA